MELVSQEGRHHEGKEGQAEALFAQAEVVLEVVSPVFERVQNFVLDFPSGAAAPHDVIDVVLGDGEVGYPREVLGLFSALLPVFQDIDEDVLFGFIEREAAGGPKQVVHIRIVWVGHIVPDGFSRLHGGVDTAKEAFVIMWNRNCPWRSEQFCKRLIRKLGSSG